jgi:hypothetical protein
MVLTPEQFLGWHLCRKGASRHFLRRISSAGAFDGKVPAVVFGGRSGIGDGGK